MTFAPATPIRLLLVDDHSLFRESLARLLGSEPDFLVIATALDAAEGLRILNSTAVDMTLLDYDLGTQHGNAFLAAARQAGYTGKILMVTAGMDAAEAALALSLGAAGIFHKNNAPASLMGAIRAVHRGETWIDPALEDVLKAGAVANARQERPHLTEREQFVLHRLFEGLTNKEVAAQLGVSESAVKATLQQLFQKTGVRTRGQLVRFALESSLGVKLNL